MICCTSVWAEHQLLTLLARSEVGGEAQAVAAQLSRMAQDAQSVSQRVCVQLIGRARMTLPTPL